MDQKYKQDGQLNALQIAYLVQQFPPEVGAGAARAGEMVSHWQRRGASVLVFTGMPNRPQGVIQAQYRGRLSVEEEWNGAVVYRSWLYASPRHGFIRTLANGVSFMVSSAIALLMTRKKIDVLIASSPPWFPHFGGWLASRIRGVPLVLEVRDLWPDYLAEMGRLRSRALRAVVFRLEAGLLRSAARIVVVTESLGARIREKGIPPERVIVIPNGVDPSQYHPAPDSPPLAEMTKASGEFLVGYLGNFGAGQNLEVILQAAQILARRTSRVRVVMAGDGTERANIVRLAKHLGLPNLQIAPVLPKESTRSFYNTCDACLIPLAPLPSLTGALPTKLFEALACERPVILCASGEAASLVVSAQAGMVARPGDPGALAGAIEQMASCSEVDRAAMGKRGRRVVMERFSRKEAADRFLDMLVETLHKPL